MKQLKNAVMKNIVLFLILTLVVFLGILGNFVVKENFDTSKDIIKGYPLDSGNLFSNPKDQVDKIIPGPPVPPDRPVDCSQYNNNPDKCKANNMCEIKCVNKQQPKPDFIKLPDSSKLSDSVNIINSQSGSIPIKNK